MKVTKQQLRQMACVIGGGHRYADKDLLVAVDTKKKVCEYSNKCARCGKEYHVEVPLQYVLPENFTDTYRKKVQRVSELIDRETTVKQICKMGEMLGTSHDRDMFIAIALFVQDDKSTFPTVEKPHGYWKKVGTSTMCSVCEHGWGKGHAPKDLKDYNFCPNCGATMDEGSDGNEKSRN